MFCSDDRHPNDLARNHIDDHVRRAVKAGFDPVTVLRAATLHPVQHYGLDVGLLREGDPADFIVVDNLKDFNVRQTWIGGKLVAMNGQPIIKSVKEKPINKFKASAIAPHDIEVQAGGSQIAVIRAIDGQLVTEELNKHLVSEDGLVIPSTEEDILKLVVCNRYEKAKPAVAFINHFGFKRGAIASTVAHDSHNIIAVGTSDDEICRAVNLLVKNKGGISLVDGETEELLPLPVAGLMSNKDGFSVAKAYDELDKKAKALGSALRAPYMTLSFMALLVIPALKLSDKGLFDGNKFEFVPLVR